MPSTRHEILVELFRRRPVLAVELLTSALGTTVPAFEEVRLDASESTDVRPTEYRADAVVVLTARDQPVWAVVVEVQLSRDRAKQWTWPVYLTTLRARLRCPTELLVVCADLPTASWCAAPIDLNGSGSRVVPLVLGPDRVPVVTDPAAAGRAPELAVLSALAHGGAPDRRAVLDALPAALAAVDEQHVAQYSDLVLAALPEAARSYLEALVTTGTYEYQSELVRKYILQGRVEGRVEGRAEGRAEDVIVVLDARGIEVPDAVRTRIGECRDLEQLDTWMRRAATATAAEDLFG